MRLHTSILCTLVILASCGARKSAQNGSETLAKDIPVFCADSAFSFIKAQTDFGPRVPNTSSHKACAEWLAAKLAGYGVKVSVSRFETVTFDNTRLECTNIIGRINPESTNRVILCSHWDSRPWADNDPDPANHNKPVDAANDGASGVGVILEIARQMQAQAPGVGVDLLFLDAEDWGPGSDFEGEHEERWWGLGTQKWARDAKSRGYKARYAILLDMVGGKGASFCREGYSMYFGKSVVDKVWGAAGKLGYGSLFLPVDGGYVTDDHFFINMIAGIPAIDIVPYLPNCKASSFGPTWHTTQDNIDNIDKKVLEAVGNTMMYVIYNEKP